MLNLNWPENRELYVVPDSWLRFALTALLLCWQLTLLADETKHHHHSAHVHDVTHLSLISEDAHLRLELQGAAAGFLGFEHAPENNEEMHAVATLKQQLQVSDNVFLINSEARCSLQTAAIRLPGLEHDTSHKNHIDDHDEGHADVEAHYDFTCHFIDEITTVTVTLFEHFTGIKTVEAIYLLEDRQSAQTLRPDRPVLQLR